MRFGSARDVLWGKETLPRFLREVVEVAIVYLGDDQ